MGTVFGAVVSVVGGLFGLLTILILTFYILIEADSLRNRCCACFPRAIARASPRRAATSRSRSARGSAASCCSAAIIGTHSAIGLWLLGVPFFYVLALISGVGELIPVVGPILVRDPRHRVAATVSLKKVLLVILFFIVQQQFENHVLVPKVMQRQVGVSPVTVIVALLIGGKLLGIVGAILAVPTAAILQVVIAEMLAAARPRTTVASARSKEDRDPGQHRDREVEHRQRPRPRGGRPTDGARCRRSRPRTFAVASAAPSPIDAISHPITGWLRCAGRSVLTPT